MDITFNPGRHVASGLCLKPCKYQGNKWKICDNCRMGNRFKRRKRKMLASVLALTLSFSPISQAKIDTCFSPYEKCEDEWSRILANAKKEIIISCFGFANNNLANTLAIKAKSGVNVIVLEDKRMAAGPYDLGKWLAANGVEVVVKKTTPLEHNKMVVVDRKIAIIGSWNLSQSADKQDNSMVITDDPQVVRDALRALQRIYDRDRIKT